MTDFGQCTCCGHCDIVLTVGFAGCLTIYACTKCRKTLTLEKLEETFTGFELKKGIQIWELM